MRQRKRDSQRTICNPGVTFSGINTKPIIANAVVSFFSFPAGQPNKPPERRNIMGTNVYEVVNNRIIELLERGINVFLLAAMPYSSPYFLTFNQAKSKSFMIKKYDRHVSQKCCST